MDAAKALLGLNADLTCNTGSLDQCCDPSTAADDEPERPEEVLEETASMSCIEKRDAVIQTSITMDHLENYSTENLTSPREMRKYLFLNKVNTNTLHYTGKNCIIDFVYNFDIVEIVQFISIVIYNYY